ncbi:AsmA family protein [Afipia sp. Root123D2]|uniref:AsmA family protein n=1 Tax=Afipia sp. Root123D2 TaxID=1736436 RepID=UPI0012E86D68|nr:AsmA family protein [Afipia sp. Root123D2]
MPIAAFLGILLIGLFAVSWLVDRDAVRQAVEAQIRAATGLDLAVHGATEISVFPASYVRLHQVSLKGGATDSALTVDDLTANLRLLPLLAQRFQIADITLTSPRINVTRDAEGNSNWAPIIETLARTLKPGADSPVSFSEIRIKDGLLTYKDSGHHIDETIDSIDLSLAWPSISRSFAATGQFGWRGERVDGSVSVADFVSAISGERSGFKTRISSAPLKFAFDGAIANRTSLMLEGTVTADSPALRNALRWAGQKPPGSSGFGRFALKARANVVGQSVALTNVNVELDGNIAEGVLTYDNNGRQTLQGTLAADQLDLTPYVSTVRLLATGARDWNRQLFDLRSLSTTDLDIRLSAAKATLGQSRLGRTALGANLRDGTLALSVGEAQIYGGIVKGTFNVATANAVADIRAQFQFTDVDLEAAASELFGYRKLTGRGNVNVALEANGGSAFALAQSVDGTATLRAHDGTLAGFNVERLLKRLERRPLSGAGSLRSGSTPFDRMDVALRINDGIATAEKIEINSPATRLTMTGTASVPAREYDLKGIASLVSAPGTPPSFQLPFVVQGPWDDPLIFPDSDILIRRSTFTAPLLNSLKDQKTRDKVQSVIDRLTGAKKPAAPAGNGSEAAVETPTDTPAAKPSAATPPAASPPTAATQGQRTKTSN